MAKKGIKKIVWSGEGKVHKDKSKPGYSVVIDGGSTVGFVVGEWFPGTTEADKKKNITWIRQSADKKVDYYKGAQPSTKPYTLFISKAQAGKVFYYVEASLTGFKDLEGGTGLFVRAYSPPRVVSSYWRENIEGNNKQIHEGNPTQYNVPLHLHLELEGLNGYNCTVHIYNCEFNLFKDDNQKISKTYTVKCNGGALDVYIPAGDVLQWRKEIGAEKPLEQFYIQLSVEGTTGYVKDTTPKGDLKHATHLFIKNSFGKILTKIVPLPKGNKVITIGEEDKQPIKFDSCTFSKINIHDRENLKTVFSNTDPRTMGIAEEKFTFSLNIFYDTDQYEVPSASQALLKNVIKYLKQNPQISVTIESYADIRNTYEYNDNLTEKRANAILSFFYTNGIKNQLKAFGYGERKAKQFDYITNEDRPIHKINRKTVLTFKVNNLKTIFYNTITPNYEEPVDLSVFVKGIKNDACISFENGKKHDLKKITYSELVNYNGDRSVVKDIPLNGEEGKLKVFSFEGDMFPSALGLKPNRYELGIHSCAYFPDPKKATLVINAFTDALWILQATYDFTGDYPIVYRGKPEPISVIKGIKGLHERAKHYIDLYLSVLKYFPMGDAYVMLTNLAIDFFVSEAEMYGIGYAKKWNYSGGKFSKLTNFTDNNRDLVEKGILTLTIIVMIVELIIAVLTMGESAAAKLPKLKKAVRLLKDAQKVQKEVKDLGFDFIFPKVAFTYATYLEKKNDLVHYVTEFNVKADPVIGIKFEKSLSLKDIVQRALTQEKKVNKEGKEEYVYKEEFEGLKKEKLDDKDPLGDNVYKTGRNFGRKTAEGEIGKGLQTLLDRAGYDAKIKIMFSGSINQEYKIKISAPAPHQQFAGSVNIKNALKQGFSNSAGKVIGDNAIKMQAELMVKGRIHVVGCVPISPFLASTFFKNSHTQYDAMLEANLESHLVHTRTYGANETEGLFYQDKIYFSGIKGKVKLEVTASKKDDDSWDGDKKYNLADTEFHLFKDKTFTMMKINLFYKNNTPQ
ncbi:OmpA family protein [Pedobacter sp. UBA5917]|jgi:outer membrane protein OmpA-like peptidoglycan-associated protein|uniref:OmpA family protein n=1 Tax=Pedobacter sp. UBA5917 TaxID=1947061 RepID=UPI0025FC0515|nr:OmpA family protein [Pedobacter sp. UBA5917]